MDTEGVSPTPLRVRRHKGLVFGQPLGFRALRLDLYLPPREHPDPPLILFVHGGGWMRGHRGVLVPAYDDWRPGPFERAAAQGYAVASVSYRLSGEARFPAQLEDLAAARTWLTQHSGTYGFDADRTVLWGSSAGAHLACLLALSTPADGIVGVVDWFGPTDLLALADQAGPDPVGDPAADDSREARLLGAPPRNVPDLARRASPVTHVRGDAPPFLIVHGTADHHVPYRQSSDLAAALDRAGVAVRFRPVEGADHMWMNVEDPEPLFQEALDFARAVTAGAR
ncbi:hypothetical protein WN71_025965 [Streptomyces mangrovisoli]|uniref:BD-FAE-like domain-containing protein n=1 Tax=Streptomyces mangrovisoli TaxID=1428628 RepID=A0A1J4NRI3_9ACTN|nr:hypothetical protein WN71_025965 [Streptomyces mangrovisoli]